MKYNQVVDSIIKYYNKLKNNGGFYYVLFCIFGFLTLGFVFLYSKINSSCKGMGVKFNKRYKELYEEYEASNLKQELYENNVHYIKNKYKFFNKNIDELQTEKLAREQTEKYIKGVIENELKEDPEYNMDFSCVFRNLLNNKIFFIASIIVSLPMYILIFIYSKPYVKYIAERLFMMVFVLIGVTVLVFTIIYISPTDPAASVLGMEAKPDQIESFRTAYGLNDPYLTQLASNLRKLVTLDLGNSFVGNEDIAGAIARRFPVTMVVGLLSMLLALIIAMPAGIISAVKQYSGLDYTLMFIALLGLSIPNFWFGLILILQFSINLKWLPATYQVGNLYTLIMPAIVFGTGMSANFARMTRSSMLEVCRADYVVTARAKGLKEVKVTFRHILRNAFIPIITVVGIQLAGTLGGAATTEKVFNINGIGTYIAERSLLPDTPAVLAGVIYMSVVISVATLVIDIIYTFLDPRIKTRLKNY